MHGQASEPVELFVEKGGVLRIVNGSPLMSDDERISIRKRFGRGHTQAAGSGLGLSIVDRLLKEMNADLALLSPASGKADGFEVKVSFPQS